MKGVKIPWESEGEQDSDAPFFFCFFFCLLDAQLCAKSDNRKWRKKEKKRLPTTPLFSPSLFFFWWGVELKNSERLNLNLSKLFLKTIYIISIYIDWYYSSIDGD